MDLDFSIASRPVATAAIKLNVVYMLHADRTYNVKRRLPGAKDIVALRTFGGTGKIITGGGDEIEVTPGSLIFFDHKQIIQYYCSSVTWDFWWFEFIIDGSLTLPLNNIFYFDFTEDEANQCAACLKSLKKGDSASSALASAMITQLIYTWQAIYKKNGTTDLHTEAVQKVIEYIRLHLHENITVKDMAHIAGFSERRFRQIFERITGKQPKQYYDDMRISIAEDLLKNTPLSICQISEHLGFSSQFHFSRTFQQKNGIRPSKISKDSV